MKKILCVFFLACCGGGVLFGGEAMVGGVWSVVGGGW